MHVYYSSLAKHSFSVPLCNLRFKKMLFSSKQYESKQRMQMESPTAELHVNLSVNKRLQWRNPVAPWNMRNMGKATTSAEKEVAIDSDFTHFLRLIISDFLL